MVLYPTVQKKAQAEIDNYFSSLDVGGPRMLTMDDRGQLPYTSALTSEILRWHPVTNISVHSSGSKEEFAFGYHIPAGTMVIANIWQVFLRAYWNN
jgi:cytochrome P450